MESKIYFCCRKNCHSEIVLIFIILLYIFQQKSKVKDVEVKNTIFFLVLFLSVQFLLPGCDKKDDITGNDNQAESIIGEWNSVDQSVIILITLNSSQSVINPYSAGIDSIIVRGNHDAVLKYLYPINYEGLAVITATNQPSLLDYEYPFYEFSVIIMGFDTAATFGVSVNDSEQLLYETSNVNIDYNPDTYTLQVEPLVLYDLDSGDSVIVQGMLAPSVVNIPANIPVPVLNITEEIETAIACNSDGSYSRFSPGIEESESAAGTWEIMGDSVKIVEETSNNTGESELDTIVFHYEINENMLILSYSEMLTDQTELEGVEYFMGLESGSLSRIKTIIILSFSREVSKSGFNNCRDIFWPGRSVLKQIFKDGQEKSRLK